MPEPAPLRPAGDPGDPGDRGDLRPGDDPADVAALARYATALADGIERSLPAWVVAGVERTLVAYRGAVTDDERRAAEQAGARAATEVGPAVRALLLTDVDVQRTSPLALLREAVRFPTEVLEQAGVPPIERDAFEERQFPDDRYGLAPASFADVDPELHEPGLTWGAAKAHVHLARRRREGRR
jgi:hypothetical protein